MTTQPEPSKWALERAADAIHEFVGLHIRGRAIKAIALEFDAIARERDEAADKLAEALQGIIDIGKRDLTNPKYDGYFTSAKEALAAYRERTGR